MKAIILGGFLGSGKTSFLLQLAEYLVSTAKSEKTDTSVVIVENEIGTSGIDNLLLERADFTVKNLFAGCACCTSSAQLEDTVIYLNKEYHPEWLIIEATGLAYPANIKQTLEGELGLMAKIIALVDAKRWLSLVKAMENFVVEQLEDTCVVLVNKIDLIDEVSLEEVMDSIKSYNKDTDLIPITANKKMDDVFWQDLFLRMGEEDER